MVAWDVHCSQLTQQENMRFIGVSFAEVGGEHLTPDLEEYRGNTISPCLFCTKTPVRAAITPRMNISLIELV
ncbi:MAG: hypothetical protein EAZ92_16275 [Candidatus Kapaibacterium sp.]|nr:MAG: hypothetical protein EAZ92_16275 [Candidatus Kapabacteria bacterium]